MIRALLLSASLLLFSCGKDDAPATASEPTLVGKWNVDKIGTDNVKDCPAGATQCFEAFTYTFSPGGKGEVYFKLKDGQTRAYPITYTQSATEIVISESPSLQDYNRIEKLTDKELVLFNYLQKETGSADFAPNIRMTLVR
jgi:hypothetical protein